MINEKQKKSQIYFKRIRKFNTIKNKSARIGRTKTKTQDKNMFKNPVTKIVYKI